MLAFLIVGFCSKGPMESKWHFGWGHATSIILWLVMLGGMWLLLISLMKGDTNILNIHYAIAGFMILLHFSLIRMESYAGVGSSISFYVVLGALFVGVGTYMVTTGKELFCIGGKSCCCGTEPKEEAGE
jgi:hypothetical protein